MNLQITPELTVSLQARSTFEDDKKVYAQYQKMVKDEAGNWILDAGNQVPQVAPVADGATDFDAYCALSNADQIAACATAIANELSVQ